MKKLHGVHVPHNKNTAGMKPVRLPIPASVVVPMSMGIGAPAKPIVKPGDAVKVGQMIAEAGGFVSANIHSGVSGTVKKVAEMMGAMGRPMQTIEIATDGLQETYEDLQVPEVHSLEDLLKAVKDSGVVGLGGAGFPTMVKLAVKDIDQVRYIVVNGAECEPFITSDTRTMLDRTDDMMTAARVLVEYLKPEKLIFGIESNKPECIKSMNEAISGESRMEVKALPPMYPQGGEKVLIYHTTGGIVPEGKLPLDAGAVVLNVTTLAVIGQFLKTGMPLVEKVVTIDGSAVKEPKNVIVPIGMKMKDVFEAAGGFTEEPAKVLYGGPMMGIAVPDLEQPVLKSTNALLAFNKKDAVLPEPSVCIRCGKCIQHCPLNLMPAAIESAYKKGNMERLDELKVNICMECGCCSFGCPANRPLVQTNKLAKAQLMAWKKAKEAKK